MSGSSLHSWSYAESFAHDEHVVISEYLLIFVSCLGLSLIIHYVVDDILKWRSLAVPSTLLLGMCVGLAIRLMGGYAPTTVYDQTGTSTSSFSSTSSSPNSGDEKHSFDAKLLGFSPTIFFFGFLPPIIFNSGYHLKRKLFFSNFGAIFSLAIVGTCMSLLGFALGLYILCHKFGVLDAVKSFEFIELVAFGALISSTDPVSTLSCFSSFKVDPTLFYLVFGESVLNDAIAITVFNVASKYVGANMSTYDIFMCILRIFICFVVSCFIGYIFGILSAFLFKFIDFKKNKMASVSVFITTVYVPFFISETLQLSGIVTIFFSGISARRYISKNIDLESRRYASFVFQMLTNLADTACFMLLGMSVFSQSYSSFGLAISCWATLLCFLTRAFHVYPLLNMINFYRKFSDEKKTSALSQQIIPANTMHMIFLSGLRGAVAFSMAQIFPDTNGNRHIVLSTTTVIILFSVFVTGGLTGKLIELLKIPINVNQDDYLSKIEKDFPEEKEVFDFEKMYIYDYILKSPNRLQSPQSPFLQSEGNWENSSGGGSYFADEGPSTADNDVFSLNSPYLMDDKIDNCKYKDITPFGEDEQEADEEEEEEILKNISPEEAQRAKHYAQWNSSSREPITVPSERNVVSVDKKRINTADLFPDKFEGVSNVSLANERIEMLQKGAFFNPMSEQRGGVPNSNHSSLSGKKSSNSIESLNPPRKETVAIIVNIPVSVDNV